MPLSDSQVRALKAGDRRQSKSVGDSLILVIESVARGGGKSFEGRMRFPPGRQGKQVPVRIGPYGKGLGKWSLKEAREEWDRIRAWSKQTGLDPRDLKRQEQKASIQQHAGPTLEQAAASFLDRSDTRERTKAGYRNMLWNQVLPVLGGATPVEHFSWDHKHPGGKNGRQVVMDLKTDIERRAPVHADKVLMVLRQVFDHAIDQGWMARDQNPALGTKGTKSKHKPISHPTLRWEQLPEFFQALEQNQANGSHIMICAVKVLFMTFLRVGSMTPMQWSELDFDQDIWIIPAERMKSRKEHIVPLTAPLKELLESLRKIYGDEEFVFPSPRSRDEGYLNPYSINQYFIRMGYKSVLTAHGIRAIPLTAGQEVLGFSAEVIQRQMAHAIGDKIRQAYDRSQMLEERRKFMVAWCDALLAQGLTI
jgi:integrase